MHIYGVPRVAHVCTFQRNSVTLRREILAVHPTLGQYLNRDS